MNSTIRCGESHSCSGVQGQVAARAMNKAKNVVKAVMLSGKLCRVRLTIED